MHPGGAASGRLGSSSSHLKLARQEARASLLVLRLADITDMNITVTLTRVDCVSVVL